MIETVLSPKLISFEINPIWVKRILKQFEVESAQRLKSLTNKNMKDFGLI